MAYEVPALPYDYAALEPHIDEATMKVHHDKHHQAYVDKVNAALEGTDWADKPIEDVIAKQTHHQRGAGSSTTPLMRSVTQRKFRRFKISGTRSSGDILSLGSTVIVAPRISLL